MKRITGIKALALAVMFSFGLSFLAGCSSGPSAEELQMLDDLKKEVASLEREAESLKNEKANLEKQIADANKKLADCAKVKEETQANLKKIGK